jgi:hypothetical protein
MACSCRYFRFLSAAAAAAAVVVVVVVVVAAVEVVKGKAVPLRAIEALGGREAIAPTHS